MDTYTSGGPPEVYVSICQGPFGCNVWPRQAHRFIPTHTSQWVRVQEKPVNSGQLVVSLPAEQTLLIEACPPGRWKKGCVR